MAQHLGVLDEVSGLLAAARLVNAGSLDAESFARCRRVVADRFEVLTGLPRPDRWVEARPGVLDAVLERAAEVGDVVVDTGFSLEDDAELGPSAVAQPAHPRRRRSGRPGGRGRLRRADRAGPAGPHPGGDPRQHGRARHGGRQPDARLAGLEPSRHRRHGRGLRPARPACTSCPRTGRPPTRRWWPAGPSSSSATQRCARRWPRCTTPCCRRARLRAPPISR